MSEVYIDPSRANFEAFKALPRDEPIHMLNLLLYRDLAEYQLRDLGFDYTLSQPDLVASLFSGSNSAGLFTQSQLGALNVPSPLLARNPTTGEFTLTIGVEKSTTLTSFTPFPFTAPQTLINTEGKLEFRFTSPDNKAFFILKSNP